MSLLGKKIVKLACGGSHTLALTTKGEVYSWGLGRNGRLGNGSQNNEVRPKLIEFEYPELPEDIKVTDTSIACGWSHSLVVKRYNAPPYSHVFSFGKGDSGQLGHGNTEVRHGVKEIA
jgi:alpha-tubulin suppressor-like RCC1 family protein